MVQALSKNIKRTILGCQWSTKRHRRKEMILPRLEEVKRALTLYHFLNMLLSIAFLVVRGIPEICELLFTFEHECAVDSREREILMFLAVIIVWKGRKATNWMHYVNNIFLFSKVANVFLFLRADPLIGIVYLLVCVVVTVVVPEPIYNGPENVTYFQGAELYDQLTSNRNCTWVVMFYATWSPDCKHVTPVFAELSEKFTLPNLRFGKLDVGRWPKEAERFRVNAHPTSRQLPTVCVFRDAKEVVRRPLVNDKRRAIPFVFTKENCILDFDLHNLYNECMQKIPSKTRKAMEEEKKSQ